MPNNKPPNKLTMIAPPPEHVSLRVRHTTIFRRQFGGCGLYPNTHSPEIF